MDPQKFEAKSFRMEGAFGINITSVYIDLRYSLQYEADANTTKSGLIELFSLIPSVDNLPTFRGRWDNEDSAVDVDLEGSLISRLAFKRNLPGYRGHHTKQITESPRRYAIDLRIPGAHVFQGEITLGTKIGIRLADDAFQMKDEVRVSAPVVRPNLRRRFVRWIRNQFRLERLIR
jgi:hypothetical protein